MLLAHEALDLVAYNGSFLAVAVGLFKNDVLALVVAAINILGNLPFVFLDETVSGLHDALGASIVLFEFEEFGALEHLLEIEDVVDIGTAESVDTLGIIAHNTDVLVVLSELEHD